MTVHYWEPLMDGEIGSGGGNRMLRDRIKELRRVPAKTLRKNPQNWRQHPPEQRQALREILERVGYVDGLVAREMDDGVLELVDGHLRADVSDDEIVPVLVVDLTDEEAKLLLATFDPLSAMAEQHSETLRGLLDELQLPDLGPHLGQMLGQLRDSTEEESLPDDPGDGKKPPENDFVIPAMELGPDEHYDFLVVMATGAREWNVLVEKLGLQPRVSRKGRFGICRGIKAEDLIARLK